MSTTTQETSWINILHSETLCLGAQSCPTLCDPVDYSPPGSSVHGDSPAKNTGLGCHALLQGIFPTQGLNPDLLQCRQILYWLSHQGSSRILEWVAYPFSKGSSPPRNWTRVSCIAGRFFTSWATRETPMRHSVQFSSVQSLSHVRLCDPMKSQHARPPCPSPTPGVYWNSCPLSQWCHPAISSSVIPFSSCPQSLPASGSFPMSQLFAKVAKVLEFQLQHQSFQ